MKYKIVKIEKETNRFVVEADFYDDKKKVGSIKHAFPLEMSEKEIEEKVKKACELCQLEKEQAIKQAEIDKKEEQAKKTIKNLIGKESKI